MQLFKSLKEAVADPTYLVTVNLGNNIWVVLICVAYNVVCMGTVNNSNMIWHVLICVVF